MAGMRGDDRQPDSMFSYVSTQRRVPTRATQADGFAEREAGLWMSRDQGARRPWCRRTVGADKGYDMLDFAGFARDLGFTPHIAQNLTRPRGAAPSTVAPPGIRAT